MSINVSLNFPTSLCHLTSNQCKWVAQEDQHQGRLFYSNILPVNTQVKAPLITTYTTFSSSILWTSESSNINNFCASLMNRVVFTSFTKTMPFGLLTRKFVTDLPLPLVQQLDMCTTFLLYSLLHVSYHSFKCSTSFFK